jgi:hypothetical protein
MLLSHPTESFHSSLSRSLQASTGSTREAFLEHEQAKGELKALVPADAKEATGYGVRAKRSKSGAISFDLVDAEASHAPLQ